MKKIITIIGIFGLILAQAQVGINTDTPKATLDVKKNPNLEKTVPQGFIPPKLTTAERSDFTNVEEGMMIYNLDKKCVEMYLGVENGLAQWQCMHSSAGATGGSASASINNKTVYVVSLKSGATVVQGEISNTKKLVFKIPYTQGQGSYGSVSVTRASATGHNNDVNNLKLEIPAGSFSASGTLTATISVAGGDGKYLARQLAPGTNYDIATFPITMGDSSFNVVVKGIGGISDRNFGNGTHDFVYLPVEVTGTHNVNGQPYKKTWLNMNLGAEYAKVGSPDFNVFVSKTGSAAHSDPKTYGSLFQWQRKADGHEFRTSTTTSTLATSWAHTSTSFITTSSSNDYNWVSNGSSASGSDLLLWQSGGSNNPCPVGYHIPTKNEWQDLYEAITGSRSYIENSVFWNQSILPNFAAAGERSHSGGMLEKAGDEGFYWSSNALTSMNGMFSHLTSFSLKYYAPENYTVRVSGFSARCVKD